MKTGGARAKRSRRPAGGARRRRGDFEEDDNDERPRGIKWHWYVIGFSILLIVGLSFLNFLRLPEFAAVPEVRANFLALLRPTKAPDPVFSPDTGAAHVLSPGISSRMGDREAMPLPKVVAAPILRTPFPAGSETHGNVVGASAPTATLSSSAVKAPSPDQGPTSSEQAVLGGIAVFDGAVFLSLPRAVDSEEVTFGAWIFLPSLDPQVFPGTSQSMKTVASTKYSGCNKDGPGTDGWALFVHEWGTTNRQLRLSWSDDSSGCNELHSTDSLVPFDSWVRVGFSLSKLNDRAVLFVGGIVVADSHSRIGAVVRRGQMLQWDRVSIIGRHVQRAGTLNPLYIGAHGPQANDGDGTQSHTFLGFIGDMRVVHASPKDVEQLKLLISLSSADLVAANVVSTSHIVVQVHFPSGKEARIVNIVDNMPLASVVADPSGQLEENLERVSWKKTPTHPLASGATASSTGAPLPTLTPEELKATWPSSWTSSFSEAALTASQREADPWAEEVREAMRHSWAGYKQRAWGHDEVHPTSGSNKDWCKMAVTLLDSLSTLWVLGLREEFDNAAAWLEKHPMPSKGAHGMHSFFEITIRAFAGLLSAHSLSGRQIFLDNARRLGDNMLPAFNSPNGFPKGTVDVGTGEAKSHGWISSAILAEVATVQVEFRYLSHHTGDPKYQNACDRAMNSLLNAVGNRGLVPIYLSAHGETASFTSSKVSFGAMGDSYYEYLLKQWQQSGKREDRFKQAWKTSMNAMINELVRKTRGGLTYICEQEGGALRHRMDHLACFVGGMLIHGARSLPAAEVDPRWEPTGAEITRTCYEMYRRQATGIAPEYVHFQPDAESNDMVVGEDAPHNLLRPEAIEAIYYMHYYTGDPKYRKWAIEMFAAFKKYTKTRYGFSAIRDVRRVPPTLSDSQESFFLAETIKYFYLVFAPRNAISLEEFVFNTEAHPLRVWT